MISLDSLLGDTNGRRPQIEPPNKPMPNPRPRKPIGPSSNKLLPPASKVGEAKQAEAKEGRGERTRSLYQSLPEYQLKEYPS